MDPVSNPFSAGNAKSYAERLFTFPEIGPLAPDEEGMIYSTSHGDTAFTVPLFDEFLTRAIRKHCHGESGSAWEFDCMDFEGSRDRGPGQGRKTMVNEADTCREQVVSKPKPKPKATALGL